MAQTAATKYSILACQAMYNRAQEHRRLEQETRIAHFLRELGPHANVDRIQRLAGEEATFQRKIAATTKILQEKQAWWKKQIAGAEVAQVDSTTSEPAAGEAGTWQTGSSLVSLWHQVSPLKIQGPLWGRSAEEDASCDDCFETEAQDDASADRDQEYSGDNSDEHDTASVPTDDILPEEEQLTCDTDPPRVNNEPPSTSQNVTILGCAGPENDTALESFPSDHLALSRLLLLDEQWTEFLELWTARNKHAKEIELQRSVRAQFILCCRPLSRSKASARGFGATARPGWTMMRRMDD